MVTNLDLKHFYSVAQYAQKMGITVQAVYKMIREDRVKHTTIGGMKFIVVVNK